MRILNKTTVLILTGFFISTFIFGQENKNILHWSATRKLTANDFAIKTGQLESSTSFAQFSVDFKVNGFDFLTKNFNKKVRNYMIRSASWIDTTAGITQSLIYQQTLFGISEIYSRQFRKALRENRKRIAEGIKIAEELSEQCMTDFAKRRIGYDKETKFGTDGIKQKEWETQVQKELTELKDFAYEK